MQGEHFNYTVDTSETRYWRYAGASVVVAEESNTESIDHA